MEQAVDFASNWVFPGLYTDASFWYETNPSTLPQVPVVTNSSSFLTPEQQFSLPRVGPINPALAVSASNPNIRVASVSPLPLTRPRANGFALTN